MSYQVEPLLFNQFKGIREYNGVNSGGQISALTCQNVDFVQTEIGSSIGIKSASGNQILYSLPLGYSVIATFESKQDNNTHILIYGENEEKGALFYVSLADVLTVLIDDLPKTGNCSGLTMTSTAYDIFVFTNGETAKTIAFTLESDYESVIAEHNPIRFNEGWIADINAVDYLGRDVKWLSMVEWNGHLVVASDYGVVASHQNDIYVWNDDPQDIADSWYIDFSQKVTAVFAFTGGLYIFTNDTSTLLTASPNDESSTMKTSSGIGCFSYTSIVKHDLYLFFYDNKQKNIYYLMATDTTGQIKPMGPVAKEIQSFFNEVKNLKMSSCIYNKNNEIWVIVDDNLLIYDYTLQEWKTRLEQPINGVTLVNNTVLTSGVNGSVYIENTDTDFADNYYPSIYKTTFINDNSNTNLKKQKTPLLITVDTSYINKFFVQLTINYKDKNPKEVKLKKIMTGIYANEDGSSTDPRTKYGTAKYSSRKTYKKMVVEISTPQVWYTLGVKIFTKEPTQGFYITSMELKNMKVKTKTKGR